MIFHTNHTTCLLFVVTVLVVAFVDPAQSVGVRGLKKQASSSLSNAREMSHHSSKKPKGPPTEPSQRKLQKGESEEGDIDIASLIDTFSTIAELVPVVTELAQSLCFSKFNNVEVMNMMDGGVSGSKPMDAIAVGDYVKDSSSSFSRVMSLGHVDHDQKAAFVRIATINNNNDNINNSSRQPIELTAKHMIFVKGKGAIPADKVRVGDELNTSSIGSSGKVTKIDYVVRDGVYAPITESGTIMVNDVQASSYAQFFDTDAKNDYHYSVPSQVQNALTHFFFAPQRMICRHYDFQLCVDETHSLVGGYTNWAHFVIVAKQFMDTTFDLSNNVSLQCLLAIVSVPFLFTVYAIEQMMMMISTTAASSSWLLLLVLGYSIMVTNQKKNAPSKQL